MNVVIYARYSSSSQSEASIEGQLKECHEYCKRNNYTVVEEYIDRAMTGKTDKRPSFLRMIADSSKKHFQYVVVYQLDRFARNRYDSATYKNRLKRNGVKVLSVHENLTDDPSSILIESVLEGMAEYYSAELAQKVTRGLDLNAEKCLSTGMKMLGYRVGKDRHYEIDPETAPLVQYIFEEYANGKTVKEITDKLNEQGYKTSTGSKFNKNSLRTILQNRRYLGIYIYKGKETPGGMPRIVSDEVFNKVAKIMEKNKKAPARSKAKVEYLLTTKLFCGHCKEMMIGYSATGKMGVRYNYYICKNKNKKLCDKKIVKKDYIENLVVTECHKLLTDKNIDKIAKEVMAVFELEKDNSNLHRLQKKLAENERKHSNMMEAIMDCDDRNLRQTFFAQISKLEEEHNAIEKEIIKEEKSQPTSLSVSHIKFFLNSLKKGNVTNIKYRKLLIDVFVNAIYLYDDRMTLVFNSGDEPVTISDKLLSEIEESSKGNKSLFLDKSGSLERETIFVTISNGYRFFV